MSYCVAFSPGVIDRLDAIEQYIADVGSPLAAARYVDAIVTFCESLALFPLRGMKRDDLLAGLRMTGYPGDAVIAYLVSEATETVTCSSVERSREFRSQ